MKVFRYDNGDLGVYVSPDRLLRVDKSSSSHSAVAADVSRGVADTAGKPLRPSGQELFAGLTPAEQDKAIGPEAAALVRDEDADLKDFVSHSKTDSDQPNWITQKPAQDVD